MAAERVTSYGTDIQTPIHSALRVEDVSSQNVLAMTDPALEHYGQPQVPFMPENELNLEARLLQEKPELAEYLKRTGERISFVDYVPFQYPHTLPSPTEVLMKLTRATTEDEIGEKGMSYAATNTAENAHIDELGLFEAEFYRDARILARATRRTHPKLLRTTILRGAELQGIRFDIAGDEEPGEVFHENRHPLDKIGIDLTRERGWSWPYYGAVDTTPNFILDVIDYRALQAEGEEDILSEQVIRKDGRQVEVRESVLAAAEWIMRRMDSNKEGLIEFKRTLPTGIENQVFKDSRDSYSRKDGSLANHEQGVASIEVQVAAYNAFKGLEEMFPENKEEYANRAEKLRATIFEHFWTETTDGEGYFVIGTDRDDNGNLRQLDTLTSNTASALDSALLEGDEEEIVRKRNLLIKSLFSEKMWSSGGIRTLASDEVRYEADAYHNGSVWPHDNAEIARGLDRHGYYGLAGKVWEKIIEASEETHLYPEKISGDNGIKPHLNHWIVDVETPEGKALRVIQPGQLLQGFDLAAYIEAKERMEQVRQGLIPGVASGDKAVLEDQVLKAVSALEATRRNNILLTPQSGDVFRGETFAAD